MKEDNIVQTKSYNFVTRIIKLYKILCKENNEFVLSKPIIKSLTSIGINIKNAIGVHTKADNINTKIFNTPILG
ncbi:MAG: four helix bundle protein [bacterium]|nr:four helix bundle protein [bacterium]